MSERRKIAQLEEQVAELFKAVLALDSRIGVLEASKKTTRKKKDGKKE